MRPDDALAVVKRPYVTEKTFDMLEKQNKIVFLVDDSADKLKIKNAIETLYEVEVNSVRTVRTIVGKKAYVKLAKESPAGDLATKLGLV